MENAEEIEHNENNRERKKKKKKERKEQNKNRHRRRKKKENKNREENKRIDIKRAIYKKLKTHNLGEEEKYLKHKVPLTVIRTISQLRLSGRGIMSHICVNT